MGLAMENCSEQLRKDVQEVLLQVTKPGGSDSHAVAVTMPNWAPFESSSTEKPALHPWRSPEQDKHLKTHKQQGFTDDILYKLAIRWKVPQIVSRASQQEPLR